MEADKLAHLVAQAALDKKGQDLLILDVRGLSSYADFLVLVSGTSDRHVEALAQGAISELKQNHDLFAKSSEGLRGGQWALVDFGDVILHVFHQFTRSVYALEDLWSQAPKLSVLEEEPSHKTA